MIEGLMDLGIASKGNILEVSRHPEVSLAFVRTFNLFPRFFA